MWFCVCVVNVMFIGMCVVYVLDNRFIELGDIIIWLV